MSKDDRHTTTPPTARGAQLGALFRWGTCFGNSPVPATAEEIADLLRRVDHEVKFRVLGRYPGARARARRLVLWWWARFVWTRGYATGAG